MSKDGKFTKSPMNFRAISLDNLPQGRNGKHKEIVGRLLSDLQQLQDGRALKVPLSELPDSKENIRSALNRATRQLEIKVATSSDSEYLYVWNQDRKTS